MSDIRKVKLPSEEPWYVQLWRPSMAWVYMFICLFDFVLGPMFYAWFAWFYANTPSLIKEFGEWKPLTLQGGGVFHAAMGGILGVSSWSRGKENLEKYRLYEQETIKPEKNKEYITANEKGSG